MTEAIAKKKPASSIATELITHAQARESAGRLIHDALHGDVHTATASIPARDSDDDIILMAYIAQQEHREQVGG